MAVFPRNFSKYTVIQCLSWVAITFVCVYVCRDLSLPPEERVLRSAYDQNSNSGVTLPGLAVVQQHYSS